MRFNAYNNFIKDIWLELPEYKFDHQPLEDVKNNKWVGRNEIEDKLEYYLDTDKGSESGAYLITGYRGMGKTSFVKRVIEKHKINKKKEFIIREITISFGQKDIKELDILRQMIKGLMDGLLHNTIIRLLYTKIFNIKNLPFWVSLMFILLWKYNNSKNIFGSFSAENNSLVIIGAILISAIIVAFIFIKLFQFILFNMFGFIKLYEILEDLYDRCRSQITKEAGASGAGDAYPFGIIDKMVKRFPLANPKEVENEIINVLKEYSEMTFYVMHKVQFIFVFDEIDKIDPSPDREYFHEELDKFEKQTHRSGIYDFRERKRAVINILANLKYLITTAKAKFIFIAGREMFDAALADIADRQSAVSSIFHQVINVDSFLKDTSYTSKNNERKTTGLTGLTEEYLSRILISRGIETCLGGKNKEYLNKSFINKYFDFLCYDKVTLNLGKEGTLSQEATYKIIYALQNLIIYLAYRSNGSPKKLVRLIEELIKPPPDFINLKTKNSFEDSKNIVVLDFLHSKRSRYYIRLNYNNQYRFGFINYMFRPYAASFGNFYKGFSDKMLVSTPFLFDHIIKFHPYAFSLQNLELIPEVLSETRTPELRNFIEDLVSFLSQSHIRDTEIGLFEYKFIHKTTNEIIYLCKTFEEESAAFNFTLDETFHIKLHLGNKIKELRSIYKEFTPDSGLQYIKSISFLNDNLGDAQFFDGSYDEAIMAYSDAIENLSVLASVSLKRNPNSSYENFIMYIRLKLKIGLTYEKMKAYENALSVYSECYRLSEIFLKANKKFIKSIPSKNVISQILVQPFIAELYLIEKVGIEGLNLNKFKLAETRFLNLLTYFEDSKDKNYLILSNFYSNIGTLMFYKNLNHNYSINIEDYTNTEEFDIITGTKLKAHKKYYNPSSSTFYQYKKSLLNLLSYDHNYIKHNLHIGNDLVNITLDIQDNIFWIIHGTNRKRKHILLKNDKTFLKNLAIILYKIGDSLFTSLTDITDFDNKISNVAYFKGTHLHKLSDLSLNKDSRNQLLFNLIICLYYLAGQILIFIGKYLGGSFMFRKILLSFKIIAPQKMCLKYRAFLETVILKTILQLASYNSNSSDRYQIYKYMHNFGIKDKIPENNQKSVYLAASTSSEVKEALILMSELKINSIQENDFIRLRKLLKSLSSLVSPYSIITSQFVRYQELRLQAAMNDINIKLISIKFDNYINSLVDTISTIILTWDIDEKHIYINAGQINQKFSLAEIINYFNCVANSIFSLYNIIKIYNGYGVNYVMSYSSLGYYHEQLGKWLSKYEKCKLMKDPKLLKTISIVKLVEDLVGVDIIRTRDEESEYHMAVLNYEKAIQMHTQGTAYKNQILNMFYLEDDFNDSLYHISIAIERQKINSGIVANKVNKLKKILNKSNFYKYDSFIKIV